MSLSSMIGLGIAAIFVIHGGRNSYLLGGVLAVVRSRALRPLFSSSRMSPSLPSAGRPYCLAPGSQPSAFCTRARRVSGRARQSRRRSITCSEARCTSCLVTPYPIALDARGLVISLFFGLVFAGGHLNQEVRDYEGDLLNGIRTSAVVFGCRRTFLASLLTFTAAYAILGDLAALGILPRLLLWSTAPVAFACRVVSASASAWIRIRDRIMDATTVSIAIRLSSGSRC